MVPAGSSLLVGLSGGLDSVVLLHLLHQFAGRFSWNLAALHIHHGLSPNADSWAAFCAELCDRYHIPLDLQHVEITPLLAHGVEAAARKLRHQAFAGQQCDFVVLAHHADDQAETLLLQLLRGAGVRGAAAMPVHASRAGTPTYIRPLLETTRAEIMQYAVTHGLQWIDDESNSDDYYPRNFLRHRVLPVLEQRFPAYRETLSRSTRHFAEASLLLDELARDDGSDALVGDRLSLEPLRHMSLPRARNLFRYFLHSRNVSMPQVTRLNETLRQLLEARQDAAVSVQFGEFRVRRYRDHVFVLPETAKCERDFRQTWNGEDSLPWPPQGTQLRFTRVIGAGLSEEKLQGKTLSVRLRGGQEAIKPHPRAATRTLRNLLQQHHIPPWQRERTPLLYAGERLVCVVEVAIEADFQAKSGEAGLLVTSR